MKDSQDRATEVFSARINNSPQTGTWSHDESLARVYEWFTEGFDTADPRNAKVLLDELR
jgi:hypothetical protein